MFLSVQYGYKLNSRLHNIYKRDIDRKSTDLGKMVLMGSEAKAAWLCSIVVSTALARASVDWDRVNSNWEQFRCLPPAHFFLHRTRLVLVTCSARH